MPATKSSRREKWWTTPGSSATTGQDAIEKEFRQNASRIAKDFEKEIQQDLALERVSPALSRAGLLILPLILLTTTDRARACSLLSTTVY